MARGGEQRCSQVLGEAARRCELGIACELAAKACYCGAMVAGRAGRTHENYVRARAPMAEDMRAFLMESASTRMSRSFSCCGKLDL